MNNTFHNKYLKYKKKYFFLKHKLNNQNSGAASIQEVVNFDNIIIINFFEGYEKYPVEEIIRLFRINQLTNNKLKKILTIEDFNNTIYPEQLDIVVKFNTLDQIISIIGEQESDTLILIFGHGNGCYSEITDKMDLCITSKSIGISSTDFIKIAESKKNINICIFPICCMVGLLDNVELYEMPSNLFLLYGCTTTQGSKCKIECYWSSDLHHYLEIFTSSQINNLRNEGFAFSYHLEDMFMIFKIKSNNEKLVNFDFNFDDHFLRLRELEELKLKRMPSEEFIYENYEEDEEDDEDEEDEYEKDKGTN